MPFYPNEYRDVPPVDLLSWLFPHEIDILNDDKDVSTNRMATNVITRLICIDLC